MFDRMDVKMKSDRIFNSFRRGEYKRITYCMMLDKRKHGRGSKEDYPLCIRITKNRQSYYLNLDERFTSDRFSTLCMYEADTKSRRESEARNKLRIKFNSIEDTIKDLAGDGSDNTNSFTFEDFKIRYYNLSYSDEVTIYSLWLEVMKDKSVGTAESYGTARKKFISDMGNNVKFEDINRSFIERWQRKMSSSVSKTTVSIYLRTLRVVLNEAHDRGLIGIDVRSLFKKLSIGGRNSYNSRKHEYLTVDTWAKLWEFYRTKGRGNKIAKTWWEEYHANIMDSLGLMLFMYLADGMNLRDVLSLRYDDFYFSHKKSEMRFSRHKTAGRASSEVVFPILPEMQTILSRQARKAVPGGLVFDYLRDCIGNEKEEHRQTGLINHVIRDRMKLVSKALGLDVNPTPTWARHSFATNLIQAGVPKDYVSASMAHVDNGTTDNYVDHYSNSQMIQYNSLLLSKKDDSSNLLEQLRGLSSEQLEELLNKINKR